jgi:hypothetical protein
VWVPATAVADFRLMADILRLHPHLVPALLRDPVSGKFVGLRHVRNSATARANNKRSRD